MLHNIKLLTVIMIFVLTSTFLLEKDLLSSRKRYLH